MGPSMSLAIFAALVAAITVIASMTILGAVGMLFYSASKQQNLREDPTLDGEITGALPSLTPAHHSFQGQQRMNMIDARHLVGYLDDEEEPSLARFDEARRRHNSSPMPPTQREAFHQEEPAYGSPDWTEEEGATEIFSANNQGELSDFGLIEEEPTRVAINARTGR